MERMGDEMKMLIILFASASTVMGSIAGAPQRCGEVRDPGWFCEGRRDTTGKYYHNPSDQDCYEFEYKGCGGNGNQFDSWSSCMETCRGSASKGDVCEEPYDAGSGSSARYVWFYSKEGDFCRQTHFRGRPGSENYGSTNRFRNRQDCERRCKGQSGRNVCDMSHNEGEDGFGDEPRSVWYYKKSGDYCTMGWYKGRRGTEMFGKANRFQTKEDCERRCAGGDARRDLPGRCYLPMDEGQWSSDPDDYQHRYYYNSERAECVRFRFTTGGNANNFDSKWDCEQMCTA